MFGCTLENCLKKFLDAEKVENYFCKRCWHGAALKYLSVIGAAEVIYISALILIVSLHILHITLSDQLVL